MFVVVPLGVIRRRAFSGPAIGLALALFGALGLSPREVRKRVSPWTKVGYAAEKGWAQLLRWTRAIRKGALFACVRSSPPEFSPRQVAERAASTLVAFAAPAQVGEAVEAQAFRGAALAV